MSWNEFNWFAGPAALAWLSGGAAALLSRQAGLVHGLMSLGALIMVAFIAGLWRELDRPPMRTIGETRLWYALFLTVVGQLVYRRWKYPWLLMFCALMAVIFTGLPIWRPEIQSKALPPALQSSFFVPHVVVYMISYALLGVAALAALLGLRGRGENQDYAFVDNVVLVGLGFLMLGLLTGAAWAKEAWGHYWSWDPKETWALITAAAYLTYLHARAAGPRARRALWLLPAAFILLMITWLGMAALPSAQNSVHVYR